MAPGEGTESPPPRRPPHAPAPPSAKRRWGPCREAMTRSLFQVPAPRMSCSSLSSRRRSCAAAAPDAARGEPAPPPRSARTAAARHIPPLRSAPHARGRAPAPPINHGLIADQCPLAAGAPPPVGRGGRRRSSSGCERLGIFSRRRSASSWEERICPKGFRHLRAGDM